MHNRKILVFVLSAFVIDARAQTTTGTNGPNLTFSETNCVEKAVAEAKSDRAEASGSTSGAVAFWSPSAPASGGQGPIPLYAFDTNGLWIDLWTNDSQSVYLKLHNTTNTEYYQLLSATNLLLPGSNWILGEFKAGAANTNETLFQAVPVAAQSTFFRGHQADSVVSVQPLAPVAIEPDPATGDPGQMGSFFIYQNGPEQNVTVYYTLSGTAQSNLDYAPLPGLINLATNGEVDVQPRYDTNVDGVVTLTLTIVPNTNYLIVPGNQSASIQIADSSTTVIILWNGDAVEPFPPGQPGQNGQFQIQRADVSGRNFYPQLQVYYQITGTASNGVDYQLLSGQVTFAQGGSATNVDIVPLAGAPDGTETVTLSLVPTHSYLVDSNIASATVLIYDPSQVVGVIAGDLAIEANGPPGEPAYAGWFTLLRTGANGFYPALTVDYSIGGAATAGLDYSNLSGTATFSAGQTTTNVYIAPLADPAIDGAETVILTLLTNGQGYYSIDPNYPAATNYVQDSSTTIDIYSLLDAIRPCGTNAGQTGIFRVALSDSLGLYPRHDCALSDWRDGKQRSGLRQPQRHGGRPRRFELSRHFRATDAGQHIPWGLNGNPHADPNQFLSDLYKPGQRDAGHP